MANRMTLIFRVGVMCDGVSAVVSTNLKTGPFEIGSGVAFTPAFDFTGNFPSSMSDLTTNVGGTISAVFNNITGAVTFTFDPVPPAGIAQIIGQLNF